MKPNAKIFAAVAGVALAAGAMALAPTTFVSEPPPEAAKVGDKAPAFTVTDTDGKEHVLADYTKQGKVVVLEWFNSECPFVVKHHQTFSTMTDLAKQYKEKDVVWLAVNSGAPGKQGAGRELNARMRTEWKIEYPILLDESGTVGRAYGAKTTPHMFVIDKEGVLRYAGAIDDNSSPSKLGETNYVKDAVNAVLAGETVTTPTSQPYGCAVKYGR